MIDSDNVLNDCPYVMNDPSVGHAVLSEDIVDPSLAPSNGVLSGANVHEVVHCLQDLTGSGGTILLDDDVVNLVGETISPEIVDHSLVSNGYFLMVDILLP